jgi:hypothetical protein
MFRSKDHRDIHAQFSERIHYMGVANHGRMIGENTYAFIL